MQRTHWLRTATVLAAALAASAAVQAADVILIASEGIKGSSRLVGSSGVPSASPFEANSFQWGVGRNISNSGGQRVVGQPMLSDITWTQPYDSTYNTMNQRLLTNKVSETVVVDFGRSSQDGKFETQLQIATGGSAFTGLSVSSGGARPDVSASQAFQQIKLEYSSINPRTGETGKLGTGGTFGYDLATAKLNAKLTRYANARNSFSSGEASGLYLRLGSGDNRIMGDSTDKGYEDWIKIDSFQMGLGMGVAPRAGTSGGFNFSQPSISEVTLSHAFDGAALTILANVLQGTQGLQATLEFVERRAEGSVTTMQLELDDVLFSGISFSSGGGLPNVSESLNFSGYTQRIWDIDPRTGLRSEQASVFSYDMVKGKVRDTAPDAFEADGFFGKGNLSGLSTAAAEIQLPPAGGLAPVPEPSTYAMLLLGLGGLGVVARRRGQRQGAPSA